MSGVVFQGTLTGLRIRTTTTGAIERLAASRDVPADPDAPPRRVQSAHDTALEALRRRRYGRIESGELHVVSTVRFGSGRETRCSCGATFGGATNRAMAESFGEHARQGHINVGASEP